MNPQSLTAWAGASVRRLSAEVERAGRPRRPPMRITPSPPGVPDIRTKARGELHSKGRRSRPDAAGHGDGSSGLLVRHSVCHAVAEDATAILPSPARVFPHTEVCERVRSGSSQPRGWARHALERDLKNVLVNALLDRVDPISRRAVLRLCRLRHDSVSCLAAFGRRGLQVQVPEQDGALLAGAAEHIGAERVSRSVCRVA